MAQVPAARILVVDDEALQMKALCETLRDHGYDTAGVGSGEAALVALGESKFDLVLTDLMMPGIDGISLLKVALEQDANLVGIVMTGEGTIATAVEAMKVGAVDYILKPFRVSVILPVLSRALAMRRLHLENVALQTRVQQRTAQLEQANEELDAFASSVAHDLQAPARHVTGFAHMLLEEYGAKLDPTALHYVRTICNSSESMGRLIADLLAFSRFSRKELERRLVDLGSLATRVWHELKQQRELVEPDAKDRVIRWNCSDLPTVEADESMLRQVFINLFSNAVKYTRGRNPAEVEVGRATRDPGEVTIYVRDNGVGFNMRYAEKLFGMFQRLHRTDEFEGNGVGLANVRRVIQRHGGRIWAEAEEGKGATFYFALPIASAG